MVPVLWLDEIGEGLWVLVWLRVVLAVTVLVVVVVIGRPKVLHLVDAPAFRAALYRTVTGDGEPDGVVRVSGAAGATKIPILGN